MYIDVIDRKPDDGLREGWRVYNGAIPPPTALYRYSPWAYPKNTQAPLPLTKLNKL